MKQIFLLAITFLSFQITCLSQVNNSNLPISTSTAYKFDEYFYDSKTDNEANINRFAEALKKAPQAKGYIIAYESRISYLGDVMARGVAGIASFNLTMTKGNDISPERIVTVIGGFREKRMVELFIVPPNAPIPKPTPTFNPNQAIQCPRIYANSEYFTWDTSLPIRFYTVVETNDKTVKPKFNWTVSSGKIINGQGTSVIQVEQPNITYSPINASVKIDGFPTECKQEFYAKSSESLTVFPLKIDEFSRITCEEEAVKLDVFTTAINSNPLIHGYIIFYEAKSGRRNEAKARAVEMKARLTQFRRFTANRITIIDGGFRDEVSGELWIGESTKSLPKPTPTVNAKDVKLKGMVRIINKPRRCDY